MDELFARLGVDDGLGRPVLGGKLADRDLLDLVEQAQNRFGRRDGLIHAAEERRGGELGGLIDPHEQNVFFRHLKLDP